MLHKCMQQNFFVLFLKSVLLYTRRELCQAFLSFSPSTFTKRITFIDLYKLFHGFSFRCLWFQDDSEAQAVWKCLRRNECKTDPNIETSKNKKRSKKKDTEFLDVIRQSLYSESKNTQTGFATFVLKGESQKQHLLLISLCNGYIYVVEV